MISRSLAAAVALGFGLSTIAQTQLALAASAEPASATTSGWVDPPRTASPAKPAAISKAEPVQAAAPIEAAPREAASAPVPAPVRVAPVTAPKRPAGYRNARYSGGEGASWKTARNAYGFSGSYGGCRYIGHAGPRGFSIDRVC